MENPVVTRVELKGGANPAQLHRSDDRSLSAIGSDGPGPGMRFCSPRMGVRRDGVKRVLRSGWAAAPWKDWELMFTRYSPEVVWEIPEEQGRDATKQVVRTTVKPVVDATLAGSSRAAAIVAVLQAALMQPKLVWMARAWGAAVMLGAALTAFVDEVRWAGCLPLGAGVAVGVGLWLALYVAVGKLRQVIAEGIERTMFRMGKPEAEW